MTIPEGKQFVTRERMAEWIVWFLLTKNLVKQKPQRTQKSIKKKKNSQKIV